MKGFKRTEHTTGALSPCVYCEGPTRVCSSNRSSNRLYRRRECKTCGGKFSTAEVVIGHDGRGKGTEDIRELLEAVEELGIMRALNKGQL